MNPTALAAVTAALRETIAEGIGNLGTLMSTDAPRVTSVPPDRVRSSEQDPPTVNLFLFHVSPNASLRNSELPTWDSRGNRTLDTPLALDLHYLLTVHANKDLAGEILLGEALLALHEHPVLSRERVQGLLDNLSSQLDPPMMMALQRSGIEGDIERVRLTPGSLSAEEISKLWSAFQTPYRTATVWKASVILIRREHPRRSPLPVLTIGPRDASGVERGVVAEPSVLPPIPTLEAVLPPNEEPAAVLGELLTLMGTHLAGAQRLVLTNLRRGVTVMLPVQPAAGGFTAVLQSGSLRAGLHAAHVEGVSNTGTSDARPWRTAMVPVAIAPTPSNPSATRHTINPPGGMQIVVDVKVIAKPSAFIDNLAPVPDTQQDVELMVGSLAGERIPSNTALIFRFPGTALPAGEYALRLRVDGVESRIVDRATRKYTNTKVTVP